MGHIHSTYTWPVYLLPQENHTHRREGGDRGVFLFQSERQGQKERKEQQCLGKVLSFGKGSLVVLRLLSEQSHTGRKSDSSRYGRTVYWDTGS